MLVPVLSSRVSDPRWFNTDPDPAFLLTADPDPDPDPDHFVNVIAAFLEIFFQVICFSLTLIPVTLRTCQNNNFFPWEKMPKRTFLQIKKIFHNLSAIYTVFLYTWIWIRNPAFKQRKDIQIQLGGKDVPNKEIEKFPLTLQLNFRFNQLNKRLIITCRTVLPVTLKRKGNLGNI